jgi:hypothetical protein
MVIDRDGGGFKGRARVEFQLGVWIAKGYHYIGEFC